MGIARQRSRDGTGRLRNIFSRTSLTRQTMNQVELHEPHERILNELEDIAFWCNNKDECDVDLLRRIEILENTKTVVTISRVVWWKEYLYLTTVLVVGILIGFAFVDMGVAIGG